MEQAKKQFSAKSMFFVYVITAILGVFVGFATTNNNAVFATDNNNAYYYNNLVVTDTNGSKVEYTLAKKFYNALDSINNSGDFKKGTVSYSLDDVLSEQQVKVWVVDGNLEIPKAFGAARDSYLMDHPELFYVDMYKLTISAKLTNGVYSAVIDTGRQANSYPDNTFKNEQQVADAITLFNNAVQSVVTKANAAVKNMTESETDRNLALAVNEIIASKVKYDFAALKQAEEDPNSVSVSSMTFKSYGALLNNKAVCSGYSMAYKVVMDELNIPCVVVSGYSKGKETDGSDTEGNIGHSWNYVYLKTGLKKDFDSASAFLNNTVYADSAENKTGAWFAFDTTWNSVKTNKNTYTLMDAVTASKTLIPDGIISSSNYSLSYPALSSVSYTIACSPSDTYEKIDADFSYSNVVIKGEKADQTRHYVSYMGKGAVKLLEENNLRIATRSYIIDGNNGNKIWTKWQDLEASARYEEGLGIVDQVVNTLVLLTSNIQLTQYAVLTDVEPTEGVLPFENIYYAETEFAKENIVYMSEEIENFSYGKYTPAPYIDNVKSLPNAGTHIIIDDNMRESETSNLMADKNAVYIKLVYDEPLHILDPEQPIGITFTPTNEDARAYSGFVKFSDGQDVHLIKDSNGVLNTIEFKFKPSLMYAHNEYGYKFEFQNIGSAKIVEKDVGNRQFVKTTSNKAPNSAYYRFSRNYYACPRVFGDGRLWIDCCAQPTLVDNSDLSADNFKDELGNTTFNEKERSQMMLVVNKTSKSTEETMLNEIDAKSDINVSKDDIIKSQTFDINLQICGKTKQIPDGSYVKIALGFPDGYGPDDEGVAFKIFHRKHIGGDNYIIEEVPCVVTKFGIVASVTSFSPYMIAVVPSEKATEKTVYASVDGKGGKLNKADGQIKIVSEGGNCEYTICADSGYRLYKLTLNGNVIDIATRVSADNKIVLSYEELKNNNELEMQFIEEGAIARFNENNFVAPVKIYVSEEERANMFVVSESVDDILTEPATGSVVGTILIALSLLFVGIVVGVLIYKKKSLS